MMAATRPISSMKAVSSMIRATGSITRNRSGPGTDIRVKAWAGLSASCAMGHPLDNRFSGIRNVAPSGDPEFRAPQYYQGVVNQPRIAIADAARADARRLSPPVLERYGIARKRRGKGLGACGGTSSISRNSAEGFLADLASASIR